MLPDSLHGCCQEQVILSLLHVSAKASAWAGSCLHAAWWQGNSACRMRLLQHVSCAHACAVSDALWPVSRKQQLVPAFAVQILSLATPATPSCLCAGTPHYSTADSNIRKPDA